MKLKIMRLSTGLLALLFSAALFASPSVWIDVRTPDEFAAGHVPLATNIPYEEIGDRIGQVTQDKDAHIYVYCRSGHRAGIAKETLEKAGYTHVVNLGGLENAEAAAAQATLD
jgi:phage shock protein E